MSVAVARAADLENPIPSALLEISDEPQEDVDWGTATPVNAITDILNEKRLNAIIQEDVQEKEIPTKQHALLLLGLKQPFQHVYQHEVPRAKNADEILVQIKAIGLNPIDWKSVDFGFGIPKLPYCAGRDFAGVVARAAPGSRFSIGETVLCPSTDYRDDRKAAFQNYAIAAQHTLCRLPQNVSYSQGAALGVAYVAASVALGVCLGLALPEVTGVKESNPVDIREIVRRQPLQSLPQDTVLEILSIKEQERPRVGDWLVIWGGSSTSALFLSQIARMAGLRVVLVLDMKKHGSRFVRPHGCTLVDSHNTERTIQVIKSMTGGTLKYAVDTVGKRTADALVQCLQTEGDRRRAQMIGLAALPKERIAGVVYHTVPVKLFHEVPPVGSALTAWLEAALASRAITLPEVEEAPGGLSGINAALDRMRQGQISGKRLVVPL